MDILVLGSGGREHAIIWKLSHSPMCSRLWCAPGSDGMIPPAQRVDLDPSDTESVVRFARDRKVDLVVVGPENPLIAGVADAIRDAGIMAFGPSALAARLEGSKTFAKSFMESHAIPTARYRSFSSRSDAEEALRQKIFNYPVVIKADGLAAGKGVVIAQNQQEAFATLHDMMEKRVFGSAGERVILEEYLQGEEVSFMVFSDGRNLIPMIPAQDHKRVNDGDQGPNTGGMGAYADESILTREQGQIILETIIHPTIRGMATSGTPFQGVLFAGIILTTDGPKTLEFNVRLGDPETQVVLPRITSDLLELMVLATQSQLDRYTICWDPWPTVTVVLTSEGYPGSYPRDIPIQGVAEAAAVKNVHLFHAGTRLYHGELVTAGGRVLDVTARGPHLQDAIQNAYEAVTRIHFDGMHYRKDIGYKGLARTFARR